MINWRSPVALAGGVWSLPALLTRGLRRVALDEGTCGGCGRTNATISFSSASLVHLRLDCCDSKHERTESTPVNNVPLVCRVEDAIKQWWQDTNSNIRWSKIQPSTYGTYITVIVLPSLFEIEDRRPRVGKGFGEGQQVPSPPVRGSRAAM